MDILLNLSNNSVIFFLVLCFGIIGYLIFQIYLSAKAIFALEKGKRQIIHRLLQEKDAA